jgi:hypothetical protein
MSLMPELKTTDEVIANVRKIKESLAEPFDFDVHRILEDARMRQKHADREVLPPLVKRRPSMTRQP